MGATVTVVELIGSVLSEMGGRGSSGGSPGAGSVRDGASAGASIRVGMSDPARILQLY
jgi:hypothetical protein